MTAGRTLLIFASLALPLPAFGHAFLEHAIPPVGSELPNAPPAVHIVFTEPIEPNFSQIIVQNASGTRVDKNDLHLAPGAGNEVVLDLPALQAGTYTVVWRVTSVDTHKTEGSFQFTVAH